MLPFKKKEASVVVPSEAIERKPDQEEDYDFLESAMDELISAIHAKDIKGACEAFRAACELCDMEPHKEGPHTNEGEE